MTNSEFFHFTFISFSKNCYIIQTTKFDISSFAINYIKFTPELSPRPKSHIALESTKKYTHDKIPINGTLDTKTCEEIQLHARTIRLNSVRTVETVFPRGFTRAWNKTARQMAKRFVPSCERDDDSSSTVILFTGRSNGLSRRESLIRVMTAAIWSHSPSAVSQCWFRIVCGNN